MVPRGGLSYWERALTGSESPNRAGNEFPTRNTFAPNASSVASLIIWPSIAKKKIFAQIAEAPSTLGGTAKASPKCINCSHNNEKHELNNETKHSCTSKACPIYNKEIVHYGTMEQDSIKLTLFSDKLQGTLIYTDGSKMNNRVGGAFVVLEQDRETCFQAFRLSDSASLHGRTCGN
ncbi:hypothetical protein CEXT_526991 [Caerostris extrusa]|uniref:Uncharacterized protein n=1 Tax=Caerostris extrusa TaxID=172846 RepID=A0AAV4VBU9_CAEEX|nr:hypothetical protein CEXT_526991 [Caerostris extrusa]